MIELTRPQRALLERCGDAWSHRPPGADHRDLTALVALGLVNAKRQRNRRIGIITTSVRRTDAGRDLLGLPALISSGDS